MSTRGIALLSTALAIGLLSLWTPNASADGPLPPKTGVKIQFLPPPMEGTISLGIFDTTGKLVRALHQEAAIESEAFIKDINGLITFWDGKDDAGNLLPAGKYSARGFLVGDLQVEGEAFHCNDWVSAEDSARIRRVTSLGPITMPPRESSEPAGTPIDQVNLSVEFADGSTKFAGCLPSGSLGPAYGTGTPIPPDVFVKDGKIGKAGNPTPLELPSIEKPVAAAAGRENSLWVVDRLQDGSIEVKQFSQKGEFLRRLAIDPTQPQPTQITASTTKDAIALLEENAKSQRFRWLELSQSDADSAAAVSTWKEILHKTITFNDQFSQVQADLKMPGGKPVNAQDRLRIPLVANPLLQDKVTSQEVLLAKDAEGSLWKTPEGLVLKRLTDTPHLKWAVMDRESANSPVVLFQSDGAVVEEFRIARPGAMMAFDFGEFQFKP